MLKRSDGRYRVTNPFSTVRVVIVTAAVASVVALGGLAEATLGFGNLIVIGLLVPVTVRLYILKRTALMVAAGGVTVDGRSTPWDEVHELVVIGPPDDDVVEVGLRRRHDKERFFARGHMQRSKYDPAGLQTAFKRFAPRTANAVGRGPRQLYRGLSARDPGLGGVRWQAEDDT